MTYKSLYIQVSSMVSVTLDIISVYRLQGKPLFTLNSRVEALVDAKKNPHVLYGI